MEQMYLIEIFVDKVSVFTSEADEASAANKRLIIKTKFGPKIQFILKEGQLAEEKTADDIAECDKTGKRKWTRTIRVGKSYLFPSYPDTLLVVLSKFPLEIEVWNDDETEVEIFVGVGTMQWDTQFFHMLKDTADACKQHEPLAIKQVVPLFAECCCRQVGDIAIIARLSALGDSIITEYQQLMSNPEQFVFRTNRAPSMFKCERIEGDDPNFCMVGSIYETTTLEDPDVIANANKKIEVCTEMQSCGNAPEGADPACRHSAVIKPEKKYPIDKIRMGDIIGPCGNTDCPLAHKVRNYIRNLDTYKKEAAGKVTGTKEDSTKKVCGKCSCKDDRFHRHSPDKPKDLTLCDGCGGITKSGETCKDNVNKLKGTGLTPKSSKTQVNYVISTTRNADLMESMFGKDFIVQNILTKYDCKVNQPTSSHVTKPTGCGCCCNTKKITPISYIQPQLLPIQNARSVPTFCSQQSVVYNVDTTNKNKNNNNFCTDIPDDKECKCKPQKPTPPCRTFDCDCLIEVQNVAARKMHKPYCPSYKHKSNCPVTMLNEEEENKEDEEDEAEPLPYGLPPIKLGPCPVLGRPCTVPDGFARMYKTAVQAVPPPSYSDAGKVCCTKEYERIKKAIKEYMTHTKESDFRCVNKFNVDTEKRCCDKEDILKALMGKGCCGAHKLAIQEKFKQEKKG